ncbi:cell division protein FtsX [Solirhodobacter olei]|uniref:cell division protein FtsX n=1 Tax=Solirhodobacter olei TaxID=2493082 RepID=UPI000FDC0ED7|nr:FtsX-like permease family protein [Solirhodobacter olei]
MRPFRAVGELLRGDSGADRIVPPSGFTVRLTSFTSAAMAFLAVFALALSLASGRLAHRWSAALADTATIRVAAPAGQMKTQVAKVMEILKQTPGVTSARPLTDAEQKKLLEPWFGPDLPLDALPVPRLIDLRVADSGFDADGLKNRLAGAVPGAVLDDHTRWRAPLVAAADRLRLLGLVCILLIAGATAAMITLAANAALAANDQVIAVLRLIGARDVYIARAFIRRFTLRALAGALIGTLAGTGAIALLPAASAAGGFLTGLGFQGFGWLWPLVIPPLAAIVAFGATRSAAFATLRGLS